MTVRQHLLYDNKFIPNFFGELKGRTTDEAISSVFTTADRLSNGQYVSGSKGTT